MNPRKSKVSKSDDYFKWARGDIVLLFLIFLCALKPFLYKISPERL